MNEFDRIDAVARQMTAEVPPALRQLVLDRIAARERQPSRVAVAAGVASLVACVAAAYVYVLVTRPVPSPAATSSRATVTTSVMSPVLAPAAEIEAGEPPEGADPASAAVATPLTFPLSHPADAITLPAIPPVMPIAIPAIQPAPLATSLIELTPMEIAPLVIGPLQVDAGG